MQKNSTHLVLRAFHFSKHSGGVAGMLLFLFVLLANLASAQTISSISPTCATANQGFTLTVTGTGFNTAGGSNPAIVTINGSSANINVTSRTSTTVVATVDASRIPSAGIYSVRVSQRSGSEVSAPVNLTVTSPPTAQAVQHCGPGDVTLTASGAPTGFAYQWYDPSGTAISGANSSSYTTNVSADATFSVSMTAPGGCISDRRNVPVTINTVPTARISAGSTAICGGGSVLLTAEATPASPATGNYTYQWRNGSTNIPGATNSTYSATASGEYSVVITNPQGSCSSAPSEAVNVTVNSLPEAPSTTSATRCGEGTVVLGASGAPSGGSYRWYTEATGGTAIPNENGSSFETPELSTTTRYYVSVVSSGGCESSSRTAVTATVLQAPTVSISTNSSTTICGTGSVLLTARVTPASPETGSYEYQWFDGNDEIDGATDNTFEAEASGNYSVVVSITNGDCSSERSNAIEVTVSPNPTLVITNPDPVCSPGTVDLTDPAIKAGSTSGLTYSYWINAAATAALNNPDAVSQGGTYYIKGTTDAGCFVIEPVTVTINTAPTASISGDNSYCEGGSTVLTANAVDGATYQWLLNEEEIDGADERTLTVNEPGEYTVIVTSGGCSTISDEFTVTETPLPTAVITPESDTEFCEGGSVVLNASTGAGYTYRWFREGSTTVLSTQNSYTATSTGNYYVEVTRNSCVVTSGIVEVTENQRPSATITPRGPVDFCEGGSVVLDVPDNPDYTYQWFLNNVEIPDSNVPNLTVRASGSYTVVVNNNGCESTSAPIVVRVSTQNTAAISFIPPTTICEGSSTLLNANLAPEGQPAYTYRWLKDEEPIPGETGNTYAATESGNYQVVVSNGTCTKTSEPVTITVNPVPTATISGPTTFCEGGSVTLRATEGTDYTYQWLREGTAIAGATEIDYVASVPGNYTVRVTSEGECSAVSAITVVRMNPLPVATIDAADPTTICEGSTVRLNAAAAPQGRTYSYQWLRNGEEITQNGTSRQYEASIAGNYTVRVTDTTNGLNCTATTSTPTTVTVNPRATAAITATGETTFCAGGSVRLDAIATPSTPAGGGSYSYQWYNQSGIISGATGATLLATASGNYSVVIISPEGNCASAPSAPVAVTVNPVPAAPTAAPVAICGPGQVTLTASGAPSGGSYRWYTVPAEGTPINGATSASYTITITETTTFYVSAVSAGCESGRTAVTANVNTVPVASVTTAPSAPTTFCSGGSVQLTAVADPATPASGSYTYQWRNGNTNIPGATGATYTATTSGNYSVVITNPTSSGSCASNPSAPVTVTVNPVPGAPTNVTATPATICGTGSSTLSASAGANSDNIRWYSASTGGTLLQTGLTYTATVNATTTFYAASFNTTTSCESSTRTPVTVTVNPAPATPTITNLTAGRTYYTGERYSGNYFFTLTGSAPPSGGSASFSGPGVTLVNGSYRFTPCNALQAGQTESSVTIVYTVRSAGGCQSSTSTTITVKRSTYTVVLQTNPFPVCPSVNTLYTAKVYRDAVVTYPDPANIRTQAINVVSFEEDVSTLFFIEARKNNGNFNRPAQFNDASLSSTDYYEARATPRAGTLPSCASATPIFSNRIYLGVPNVNISISRTGSICSGTSVTFTATQGELPGNLTYQWTVNGVAVEGATSTTFTSSTLQNGDVVALSYAAANSGCGAVSAQNSFTIVVAVPQTITGNSSYCAGSGGTPVGLQSSQVGISYQLMRGGANVGSPVAGTGTALSFGSQPAGTYTVQPISGSGACSPAYGPITINETPLPTAFNVTGGGSYCTGGEGVPVGLNNSQSGLSYQLYNGSTPVGSPIVSTGGAISFGNQTAAGTYTVVATTVSNATTAACPRSMNGNATITINPLPLGNRTFNAPTYCSLASNGAVVILQNPENGVTYELFDESKSFGAFGGTGSTRTISDVPAGTYTIRGINASNCVNPSVGTVTVTDTRKQDGEGKFESKWVGNRQWEVTVLDESIPAGVTIPSGSTYVWYVKEPEDADFTKYGSTTDKTMLIENVDPLSDVYAEVLLTNGDCIRIEFRSTTTVPLPVELIYFKAEKRGNDVAMEWATASEKDNKGFEVQVSTDGKNFHSLAFVESRVVNSSIKQVYTFVDKENGKYGTRYYRLKQIDLDGKFEYFNTMVVHFGAVVANKVKAYPSPFQSAIELSIDAEADAEVLVTVTNAAGQQLLQRTIKVEKGSNIEKLTLDPTLPRGIYIISTRMGDFNEHIKLLKQ